MEFSAGSKHRRCARTVNHASHRTQGTRHASLLIIGLMLAAATSSIMSVMQFVSRPDDLQSYVIWTMGSVGNTSWKEIGVLSVIFFCRGGDQFFFTQVAEQLAPRRKLCQEPRCWCKPFSFLDCDRYGIINGRYHCFLRANCFCWIGRATSCKLVMPTMNHKILLLRWCVGVPCSFSFVICFHNSQEVPKLFHSMRWLH